MRRSLAFAFFLTVLPALAADPEKEAAKLIDDLPNLEQKLRAQPVIPSVAAAEAHLAAAQKRRDRWAQLVKQGVVSRAEADTAVMDYHLAVLLCERARLVEARQKLALAQEGKSAQSGEPPSEGEATSEVAEAEKKVSVAQADYDRIRLDLTRTNLGRFRKLYGEHLVSKYQLQRLENLVAELEKAATASAPPGTPAPAPAAPALPKAPAGP